MSRSICVYASSSNAVAPVFQEAARTLGRCLAQRGDTLVYGAGNLGLMGEVARATHANGGRIVGVIPEKLRDLELAYEKSDELIITRDMRERKAIMEQRADAFIALPGGFGTLEELLEILTLKQLWYHNRPLVLLNTAGIYDGLTAFFETLMQENFIRKSHERLYRLCSTPEEALDYIDAYTPEEPHGKWF